MNTTSIFIEILIIGIQGLIWIILGLLGFKVVDIEEIDFINLKDWLVLLIPVLFCLCYTIGIIIDRVADGFCMLYSPEKNLFRIKFFKKLKQKAISSNEDFVNLKIQIKESQLTKYFFYIKSRLRVLRGTTLNLFFLTIFSVIYFLTHNAQHYSLIPSFLYSIIILLIGLTLTFISWVSVAILQFTYSQRQKEVENLL